jgi:hypothetical protein
MKMCFYARAIQTEFFPHIARELVHEGVEAVFITQIADETARVRAILPDAPVYELTAFLREHWETFDTATLGEIEARFDIPSMWGLFYTDRFLMKYKEEDARRFIVGHFRFFEYVFTRESPDFFVNESVAILAAYVAYLVGQCTGTSYLGIMPGRTHALSHVYFIKEPFQLNYHLDNAYKAEAVSDEEYSEAAAFLEKFRITKFRPEYMQYSGRLPQFRRGFLLSPYLYLKARWNPLYNNKFDYISYMNYTQTLDPLRFYLRYRHIKRYFQDSREGERFLLFPLHYQPEASTLVCAPRYEKQLYTIDLLSKAIPGDSILYVKEHYAVLGHRPIHFYEEVKKYPNVRLINPLEHSHQLIQRCAGVVCITSTVGWEAMLYQKPVYLLGRIFYETAPGVMPLQDIFDLPQALQAHQPACKEDVIKYLACYFKSLRPGFLYKTPDLCDTENVRNMSTSLLAEAYARCSVASESVLAGEY